MKEFFSAIFSSVYIFLSGIVLWVTTLGVFSIVHLIGVSREKESPALIAPTLFYPIVFALAGFVVGRTKKGNSHILYSPLCYILFITASLMTASPPEDFVREVSDTIVMFSPIVLIPLGYGIGRKLKSQPVAVVNASSAAGLSENHLHD